MEQTILSLSAELLTDVGSSFRTTTTTTTTDGSQEALDDATEIPRSEMSVSSSI
jgi:hypothetical protein